MPTVLNSVELRIIKSDGKQKTRSPSWVGSLNLRRSCFLYLKSNVGYCKWLKNDKWLSLPLIQDFCPIPCLFSTNLVIYRFWRSKLNSFYDCILRLLGRELPLSLPWILAWYQITLAVLLNTCKSQRWKDHWFLIARQFLTTSLSV